MKLCNIDIPTQTSTFTFSNLDASLFLTDPPFVQEETQEEARKNCSYTDFGDIERIQNNQEKSRILSNGVWLGLKKLASAKIELCQTANISGRLYQNVSCARKLLSVCLKNGEKI